MNISIAVIVVYFGIFTIIGTVLNRGNKNSSEWATGSPNMRIWMLAAGTRIGGTGT